MSPMTVEALLAEFHTRLGAGNRSDALELIEPELPNGDLRIVLAYATAKVEDGDGLAAVSLLRQHERHSGNSHYSLLAAVAVRLLIEQASAWGERAERHLIQLAGDSLEEEGLTHQLQRYIQLCATCGVPPHPDIQAAVPCFTPLMPNRNNAEGMIRATFLGYRDGASHGRGRNIVVPGAPLFFESDDTGWLPGASNQSNLDVGQQTFKVYRNVRLYMLPFMYGLIETEDGVFLGDVIGGCNPYTQGIVTLRGDQLYKNLAHPLLAEYPERSLAGTRFVPFRLAGTYYFHFMVETLQSIFESRGNPLSIPIILPASDGFFDRIPRAVHDSAVESVRAKNQVYEFLEDGIYRLDEVVLPTRIKYGTITYQRQVLDALGITEPGKPSERNDNGKILYIARRPGMVRSVTNEEELVSVLSVHFSGFRRIYLEDMSFTDQITAFRDANIVVAPHGGGLSNIIFCHPGTSVIEFHLPNTGIMYWHISVVKHLRYLAYVPAFHDLATLDFRIQPSRLIAAIKLVTGLKVVEPAGLAHG